MPINLHLQCIIITMHSNNNPNPKQHHTNHKHNKHNKHNLKPKPKLNLKINPYLSIVLSKRNNKSRLLQIKNQPYNISHKKSNKKQNKKIIRAKICQRNNKFKNCLSLQKNKQLQNLQNKNNQINSRTHKNLIKLKNLFNLMTMINLRNKKSQNNNKIIKRMS